MTSFQLLKLLNNKASLKAVFKSQKGQSSMYIIIFIIVIIFAVMLSGGTSSLFSGNEPSSVTAVPSPTTDPNAKPTTAANSAAWNITVTLDPGCKDGKSPYILGSVKIEGPQAGTIDLLVNSKSVATQPYSPSSAPYPLKLFNDEGFNTSNWEITVTTGGVIQKTYNGTKTGC